MKSQTAILRGREDIDLRTVSFEPAEVGCLVLRTRLAGIDGTEINRYFGQLPADYFHRLGDRSCVMGDEILGDVAYVPDNVERWSDLRVGERVVVEPKIACYSCRYCLAGHDIHCNQQRGFGVIAFEEAPGLWGGFSQFVCVPSGAKVHKVSQHLSDERALLSAVVLADGIRWSREKAEIKPGDDVLVIGPGPQGLATVVGAAWEGASRIIVAGRAQDTARMKLAKSLGATHTINVDSRDIAASITDITEDGMVDAIIDCGSRECQIADMVPLLRRLGRFVVISVGFQAATPLPTSIIQKREITVVGGRGPRSATIQAALQRAETSTLPLESLISHQFPLERIVDALQLAGRRVESATDCIKAIIDFRNLAGAGPAHA